MIPRYLKHAQEMIGEVPQDLIDRLERVDCLCYSADYGHLESRQTVAVIIEQWQREQEEKEVQARKKEEDDRVAWRQRWEGSA